MIRQTLCLGLTMLLMTESVAATNQEILLRKATRIPIGAVVEVRAYSRKFRGQLLSVDAAGITVRTVTTEGSLIMREVGFAEMESVRQVLPHERRKRVVTVLAVLALVFLFVAGTLALSEA